MVGSTKRHRMVNSSLAHRIIELHSNGYDLDFDSVSEWEIICLQDHRIFSLKEVSVKIIDQVFDEISRSYKYIHTVDTACNRKGLLIIESIVIADILSEMPEYPDVHRLRGRTFNHESGNPSKQMKNGSSPNPCFPINPYALRYLRNRLESNINS